MDVNMYPLIDSSQEPLLSDGEFLTLSNEIPRGILDDVGLLMEDKSIVLTQVPLGLNCPEPLLVNSPTSQMPCMEDWPGQYNFELLMDGLSSSKRTWLYSHDLNKLFVDMNQSIPIQFKVDNRFEGDMLFIRAIAVYNVAQHLHIPVKRCPIHLKEDENRGLENINHVVQCKDKNAVYEHDDISKRYSVVAPLGPPPAGTDVTTLMYIVTCKGSCAGGMNRRPVTLTFTLERTNQEVVGRRTLHVRVCSCPKRDKRKEEMEKRVEIGAQPYQPDAKKKKLMKPKPSTPSAHEQVTRERSHLFSSSNDDPGELPSFNIEVSGTEHYKEVLKFLIMRKTYEWVKTNSPQAQRDIEQYEEMLEVAEKGKPS